MSHRVVMFTPGFTEIGGAAKRARLLSTALAEAGWEVRVLARNGSLNWFRISRSDRLVVLEIPGFRSRVLGAFLFYVAAIGVGLIWSFRAKGVVGLSFFSPGVSAGLVGRVTQSRTIVLSTTSGPLGEGNYLRRARGGWLRRLLLSRVAIGAQTPSVAEELRSALPTAPVVFLPNPVEPVVPPPLRGERRVLFTGRFSAEKDLDRLLEVWRTIAQLWPDAHLTLAGEGGRFRAVEEQLRARVRDDDILTTTVTFAGWVSDISTCLREHDLYVFPSLSEGMSNALLEACAWGRVVVASDIPSNRVILGDDYQLLYPAGSTQDLLARLELALSDEPTRVAARQTVLQRIRPFTPGAVADKLSSFITDADRTRN